MDDTDLGTIFGVVDSRGHNKLRPELGSPTLGCAALRNCLFWSRERTRQGAHKYRQIMQRGGRLGGYVRLNLTLPHRRCRTTCRSRLTLCSCCLPFYFLGLRIIEILFVLIWLISYLWVQCWLSVSLNSFTRCRCSIADKLLKLDEV